LQELVDFLVLCLQQQIILLQLLSQHLVSLDFTCVFEEDVVLLAYFELNVEDVFERAADVLEDLHIILRLLALQLRLLINILRLHIVLIQGINQLLQLRVYGVILVEHDAQLLLVNVQEILQLLGVERYLFGGHARADLLSDVAEASREPGGLSLLHIQGPHVQKIVQPLF